MSDWCPYQLIVQIMPFPFALFKIRKTDWVLTSFNDAFKVLTNCEIGDCVTNFKFDIKEARSELMINGRWYAAYSFTVSKSQMAVIMYDITEKRTFEESVEQIVLGAAAIL